MEIPSDPHNFFRRLGRTDRLPNNQANNPKRLVKQSLCQASRIDPLPNCLLEFRMVSSLDFFVTMEDRRRRKDSECPFPQHSALFGAG